LADKPEQSAKIRAVFFDLDDTLRVNDPHPHDVFTEFVSKQGIAIRAADRQDAFRWGHAYWANSTSLLDDFEHHEGYEDPFWQNYTRRHLRSLNLDESTIEDLAPIVHKYMRHEYRPESKLVPQAIESLEKLRSSGYYVGLLTNRTRPIYQEVVELGLDLHLDLFLTAGQLETFKPQAGFFDLPLDLLKLEADQVVYVGDNYFADVKGALEANIRPVLIDPRGLYPDFEGLKVNTVAEIFNVLDIAESTN
jgi:putative hydrolase of the HAD superfamily